MHNLNPRTLLIALSLLTISLLTAGRSVYVHVMDEDGLSADDTIGYISFKPLQAYGNDNSPGG